MTKNKILSKGTLVVPLLIGGGMVVALLREILIARYFGTSSDVEIFRIAYALPNLLSFSVATAFVSASVPILIRSKYQGKEYEESIIFSLHLFVSLTIICITIFGVTTGKIQARIFAPGFDIETIERLSIHIKATWFMFLFIGLSFVMRSALQAKEIFWPGASNSFIKAGVYVFVFALGILMNKNFNLELLTALAVISGFIIFIVHVAACHFYNLKIWNKSQLAPKKVLIAIGVALMTTSLFQILNIIPVFIERAYASNMGEGTIASLDYSYSILTAIGALLGTSFNMIVLPKIVNLLEIKSSWIDFKGIIIFAGFIILFTTITGAFLGYYSKEVIESVFMHGAFDEQSVVTTSSIMQWQAAGMGFMVASTMGIQILVILNKFKTLVLFGFVKIFLKIISLYLLLPLYEVSGFGISFFIVEGALFLLILGVIFLKFKRERFLRVNDKL